MLPHLYHINVAQSTHSQPHRAINQTHTTLARVHTNHTITKYTALLYDPLQPIIQHPNSPNRMQLHATTPHNSYNHAHSTRHDDTTLSMNHPKYSSYFAPTYNCNSQKHHSAYPQMSQTANNAILHHNDEGHSRPSYTPFHPPLTPTHHKITPQHTGHASRSANNRRFRTRIQVLGGTNLAGGTIKHSLSPRRSHSHISN